jgi:ABC-2 type transport system permease protein
MLKRLDALSDGLTKAHIAWLQVSAVVETDLRKLRHDPTEIFLRIIQPFIWLMIFGQAMSKARTISTGDIPYLDYIAPGILAQSILFISIFFGISLIWEKDAGILHKTLVTPAPRIFLVLGRAIAAGFRGITQAIIIYFLSYMLNIDLRFDLLSLFGILAMVILGSAIFSTFSLVVALIVKKRERFLGVGQLLTMPLFFASNALYPIDMMPHWIQVLSIMNPLTYQVDALRALMIVGETSRFSLTFDFGISLIFFIILAYFAAKMYPRILY